MSFFFPKHAASSDLQTLYLNLSPVERLMVLREFIGVTYRRRFQFFRPLRHFPSSFRRNLQIGRIASFGYMTSSGARRT